MTNIISLDKEREKRQPKVEQQLENIIIFTTEQGSEYEFSFEGALTPEEIVPPIVDDTLFGWSCTIWDPYEEEWITLPDYYKTEQAALAAGTALEIALDLDFN